MNLQEADAIADDAVRQMYNSPVAVVMKSLLNVVEYFPDIDRFQFRLGLAQQLAGNDEDARKSYTKAIILNPDFGVFHHNLMNSLARLPKVDDAVAHYAEIGGHLNLPVDLKAYFCLSLMSEGKSPESIFKAFPGVFGVSCGGLNAVTDAQIPEGIVEIRISDKMFYLSAQKSTFKRWILSERILHYVPYLDRLTQTAGISGTAWLAVDDLPPALDRPVLVQSGYEPNHVLIPDSIFLATNAYSDLRQQFKDKAMPLQNRIGKAYWRGALTGLGGSETEVMNLPRVRLARLALTNDLINAKITNTSQFDELYPVVRHNLYMENLLSDRVPEIENIKYKIAIDIDGNSNSWSGFFLKLMSGAATIKLMSPFRQWFYDRLVAGEHFVPIHDLEGDLLPQITSLLSDEQRLRAIAESSAAFISTLSCDGEFSAFAEGFQKACT